MTKTLAIDLDGVLNSYGGWKGEDDYPPPRPGVRGFLSRLIDAGYHPVVFTTRPPDRVMAWVKEHGLSDYIQMATNVKPRCVLILDDRVVCFRGDFDKAFEEIVSFKAHWEG